MALFSWILISLIAVSGAQCKSFVLTSRASGSTLVKRNVEMLDVMPAKEQSDTSPRPDIYSFSVTSNIAYRYASTVVSSRMANPANTSKEIFFTVTLPESAFISKFLMVINDKVYEAYVKEKEEAKKDYQEAVNRGETAGHVEMSPRDSNLFTVSVNVESHNKVTFNLTYEQLLTRTLGHYENIINVDPGQVVKSFHVFINIEESAAITSVEVPDLKTSNEIDAADSKNIAVTIERPKNNTAKITWAPDEKQQVQLHENGVKGQLIVRYEIDRSGDSNQILVDEGYFVHFFAPTNLKTLNKHVLFALDVSGSMGGRKIEQLREALSLILSDISEEDYFTLILFSDSVQLWTLDGTVGESSSSWSYDETTTPASIEISNRFIIPARKENIAKAKTFASTLNETGGTNIIAALRQSLEIAKWNQKRHDMKAKPLVIFLTDGQPNVEMSDTQEIVQTVKKLNIDKYPIFSLAFGREADYDFLRKLSLSNSGFARNIYVASDTSLQLKNFYKEVASPLLSNVSFAYIPGQIDENTLTKSVFNNLYNGSELVVAGKLSNISNDLVGNLTGTASDGQFCVVMPPEISLNKTSGHLEKLWAYLYIKELLDKDLISEESNSTYKQKALNLSLHYGFVTPLTSLVVIKPNETITTSGQVPLPDRESSHGKSTQHHLFVQRYHITTKTLTQRPNANMQNFYPINLIDEERISGGHICRGCRGGSSYSRPALAGIPNGYHDVQSLTFNSGSGHQPSWPSLPAWSPAQSASAPLYSAANFGAASHQTIYLSNKIAHQPIALLAAGEEDEPLLLSTTVRSSDVLAFPLNISDISWLNNRTEIVFPSSNNSYSVFLGDAPNTEFQTCVVPNSSNTIYSRCRHLAYCVLPEILNSFNDFVPYGEGCVIDARFVGICCPPSYTHHQENSTVSSTQNTTFTSTESTSTKHR